MRQKKFSWVVVLLVFIAVVAGCIYGFKWIGKREGNLVPTGKTFGYNVSLLVGVDKEFVDSALERDGVDYTDITTPAEKAAGSYRYELQETIEGLPFTTTIRFDTRVQVHDEEEEEESSSGSGGLIPDIKIADKNSEVRLLCTGYVREWNGVGTEWTDKQREAVNAIYADVVSSHGRLTKDNGSSALYDSFGMAFTPDALPESMQTIYDADDITNPIFTKVHLAWVKTIAKSSFGDDCVDFDWGHNTDTGALFVRIAEWTSSDYPYTANTDND